MVLRLGLTGQILRWETVIIGLTGKIYFMAFHLIDILQNLDIGCKWLNNLISLSFIIEELILGL